MGRFDHLPTLADVEAARAGQPQRKYESRLEQRMVEDREERRLERAFKAAVWMRDGNRCRNCERKVFRALGRRANRGEVHHLHGRGGALRHEVRSAILLCLRCHECVTGRVNERWRVVGTAWFDGSDERLIDATYPVEFERIA
jgi:hypothetical protein